MIDALHRLPARLAWTLCLLAVTLPAAYASGVELEQFESRNYVIHSNLAAEDLRPLATHMDAVFDEYSQRFSNAGVGRGRDRGKENLYLLATRHDYVEFLAGTGIDGANSGGMFFYQDGRTGLATWVLGRPAKVVHQVLQHEGFHQFAYRYFGGDLPVWLNEGLAVYFEQSILVKGRLTIGVAEPRRIEEVRDAIEADETFGIEDIINITSEQWRANMGLPGRGSLQYTQSWSICHFLIHGDRGRYQQAFNKFLELVASGRTSARAFEQAFGTDDYTALERRWRDYVLEDMEPDATSVMIERIEFIAYTTLALKSRGVPLPETLDELKAKLKEMRFRVEFGDGRVMDAADDAIYTYADRRGNEQPFEYTLGEGESLPAISAGQARPAATIHWTTINDQAAYEVRFR